MQTARVSTPLDIPQLIKDGMQNSFLKDVHFSREYPNTPLKGPTIVWRLKRRIMGKEGKETLKERIRGVEVLGDDSCVTLWGQWTTAFFQFDILHTSDDEADALMLKFELFIREMRGALGICGVDSFLFAEQLEDYTLPIPKEIANRSIRYTATMTTLYPVYSKRVNQITLSIISGENIDFLEMDRTSELTDTAQSELSRIISIGDTKDSTDYIVGVDYDLVDAGDRTATISWLPQGLHPDVGSKYYIKYSALADPKSITFT